MHSWDKFWTKDTKRPKSQLPLLKSLEQKQDVGSKSWVLSVPPQSTPLEGGGGHLRQPSSPGHTRTLTSYEENPCHPLPLPARGVSK